MTDLSRLGERRLWTAVLALALIEALPAYVQRQGLNGAPTSGVDPLKLGRARAWLRLGNPDFCEVCTLAGRDPEHVYQYYVKHALPMSEVRLMRQTKKKA